MDWKIEAGVISDTDELEQLYDDINDYLDANINYPYWKKGVYPTRKDAEDGIVKGTLFVLKISGKIAGSMLLNHIQYDAYAQAKWGVDAYGDEVMVLYRLVTHPDFMKQGVSSHLLDFAKKYALEKGCKTIRLDVTPRNIPAIALYEKHGYTYVDTVDLGLPYEHLKWFKLYELVL
ncbi:MAG: GNAT family N-acetyltransferase [Defluviitaleaceae bacterium]|nr:GNAT family N-acetyltransferase [Defluviitaleaceae bacterium]